MRLADFALRLLTFHFGCAIVKSQKQSAKGKGRESDARFQKAVEQCSDKYYVKGVGPVYCVDLFSMASHCDCHLAQDAN